MWEDRCRGDSIGFIPDLKCFEVLCPREKDYKPLTVPGKLIAGMVEAREVANEVIGYLGEEVTGENLLKELGKRQKEWEAKDRIAW